MCTLAIAQPGLAEPQASPFVPAGAAVYADIDLLTSAGLIDTVAAAARPYTFREVQRLLAEARRNAAGRSEKAEWAQRLIDRNVARYDGPPRPIDFAAVWITAMDSPYRAVPSDLNGSIEASINPLAAWRGGRPIADGATTTIETMHSVSAGRHMALAFSPRVTAERWRDGTGRNEVDATVQTGNATFLFGNLVAELGRDYVEFGPSSASGLLLSINAPPLDMVRVSTQRPATLPWILRRLGPASGMLFVADLGASHQLHPHAKLVGYQDRKSVV